VAYTTTQLADEVLRALAVVDGAETPDTTDRTYVVGRYEMLHAELSGEGQKLTYWESDEDIPSEVFNMMVDAVVLEAGPAFGRAVSIMEKMQQREVVMRRLRRHVQMQSAGTPVRADFY